MKIRWEFDESDIQKLRGFVQEHQGNAFVRNRQEKNLLGPRQVPTISPFWRAMVICLLTTQQRSGPNSAVGRFASMKPFPLEYGVCAADHDLEAYVLGSITAHGGLRRAKRIASEVVTNLEVLKAEWESRVHRLLSGLAISDSRHTERHAARQIQGLLKGFGPKQSRNLLQTLGLSRYEIPLDSRIVKWFNRFGFPVKLTSTGLSDEHYYSFVMDGIQELCARSEVYPCMLDAAIFSSYDGEAWNSAKVIF